MSQLEIKILEEKLIELKESIRVLRMEREQLEKELKQEREFINYLEEAIHGEE
jgi:predicted HTH domain antitoxin